MSDLIKKDVRYLNKDFTDFRKNLIDFAKNYFPNTYNDFNESSPGMMFIEMAAYVGDVLSFYTDTQLKESLLTQAEEKTNVLALANTLGYKPPNTIGATVDLDVFQLVPAIGSGLNIRPDYNYAFTLADNMTVSAENFDVDFRTLAPVDFRHSSSLSPTEVTVYQVNDTTNEAEFYLLKKTVRAISGRLKTQTFTFTSPKIYDKVLLSDTNIIEIVDVYDDDNEQWFQVPYLAQDTIFESIQNTAKIDPELSEFSDTVPYLLKLRKTAQRFITRLRSDDKIELQFGSGISDSVDEELIPNPDLVGNALPGRDRDIDLSIDPSNFLYTKTYGLAPANTTLTVRYSVGGGVLDNVPANELTDILTANIQLEESGLDATLVSQIKASIAATNPAPAVGGKQRETTTELQNNALATFAAQNRAVTTDDYIIRAYSMPPRFGAVAKAHVVQDDILSNSQPNERVANPFALNMYLLGYDGSGNLTQMNNASKENLKSYLSQFKILTDGVNIKDAFIVNIGIDFEIVTLPEYNSAEVLLRAVDTIRNIFDINKWQINQPILINKLSVELDKVEGVQTVTNIEVVNNIDTAQGYAGNIYNVKEATRDGVIYPSLDPMIFEIKFPNKDIRGRVVSI